MLLGACGLRVAVVDPILRHPEPERFYFALTAYDVLVCVRSVSWLVSWLRCGAWCAVRGSRHFIRAQERALSPGTLLPLEASIAACVTWATWALPVRTGTAQLRRLVAGLKLAELQQSS